MTRTHAFLALVLTGVVAGTACGLLAPTNSPRARKFDCQEAALRPVVGDVLDTKEFLRALYAGQASLGAALTAAGATEGEVKALIKALQACDGPASESDAGSETLTPS